MKSLLVLLICACAGTAAMAQDGVSPAVATTAVAAKGQMVVAANGARLGSVYRVGPDGAAQIIIDGRMVSIPANTLSSANGRLTTSLSKSEVADLH
jgi:uncharacterized metal-binding protein